MLRALQDLRRSTVVVVSLADAVILGGSWNHADAMAKLPPALRVLQQRVQAAIEALEGQP